MSFRISELFQVREITHVVIGQVAQFFGGLMFLRVATENLSPADFGTFTILLTVISLVQSGLFGGLQGGITRYYSVSRQDGELPAFVATSGAIGFGLAVVIFLAGLFTSVVSWGLDRGEMAMGLLGLAVVGALSTISEVISSLEVGARRQGQVAIHAAGRHWLSALALHLFVPTVASGYVGALWSVVAASSLIVLSQILLLFKNETITFRAASCKKWGRLILVFALPYTSWGLITWAQQVADKWLLKVLGDSAAVGLYTAMFQLAYSPILLFMAAVQRFATPVLYEQIGNAKSAENLHRANRFLWLLITVIFGFGLILVGLVLTFHHQIAHMLLGPEFREKSYLMPLFVLAGILMASYHISGAMVPAIFQAKKMVLPLIILSLVSICLMAGGAYLGAVDGIAIGLVVSGMFFFISVSFISRRLMSNHLSSLGRNSDPHA